jgi:hypothetical protein
MVCVATHRQIARSYLDRAMPEHIARAGGRSGAQPFAKAPRTCAQRLVALRRFVAHGDGVVLQPASQKRPDSEVRTTNPVRTLSFVCALLSWVASVYLGNTPLRRPARRCILLRREWVEHLSLCSQA